MNSSNIIGKRNRRTTAGTPLRPSAPRGTALCHAAALTAALLLAGWMMPGAFYVQAAGPAAGSQQAQTAAPAIAGKIDIPQPDPESGIMLIAAPEASILTNIRDLLSEWEWIGWQC